MKRIVSFVLLAAMICLAMAGCSGGNSEATMQLYVLNWGDYIDEEVLENFRTEHPEIDLHYTTMTSNEEMLIQLQSEDCIYDVCFPSDYTISKLINLDLLAEIDTSKLSNYENIDERVLNQPFDPDNTYSVPYAWGTVGILYNTTMVDEPVTSWDILWDEKYAGQIYMYDSVRDSMMVALELLGYSMNTTDPDEIAEAEALLVEQKPLVQAYGTDDLRDRMIAGSGAMAVTYSGDAIYAIMENPDLAYAVPEEGSNIWFDNVIITKSSQNVEAAYIFLDYLLDAEVAAANANYLCYSTPNAAAEEFIDPELLASDVFNVPQDVIDRCEGFIDLEEDEQLYHSAWTRIKAQ